MSNLIGVTSFRDKADHTTMASVETVTVSTDRVEHRIAALGDKLSGPCTVVVESQHPEVIRYLNQVIAARKANEYQLVPYPRETP